MRNIKFDIKFDIKYGHIIHIHYLFTLFIMETYEDTKYFTDKEHLKETLDMYGVAIIPNVLNSQECKQMTDGMWDYFEHITQEWPIPISRRSIPSWREIYKLYPKHSMLFQHHGVGHMQTIWDIRQHPDIVDIFAHFWSCTPEDLLVSFDGCSFNIPPEETNRGWNRNHTWYHCDQSPTRNGFECVQSWVTGLDVNEGDATLAFMEGSQAYHAEFGQHFGVTEKKNWYKLQREEEQFYIDKGCAYKKVKCPKGSMVFWDSRTIHCGTEAMRERPTPTFRAVIYLCYMPRHTSTERMLRKKQKAFNELRTTSHWANKPTLFSKDPRTYGGVLMEYTPIDPPIVSELGRTLAGF